MGLYYTGNGIRKLDLLPSWKQMNIVFIFLMPIRHSHQVSSPEQSCMTSLSHPETHENAAAYRDWFGIGIGF